VEIKKKKIYKILEKYLENKIYKSPLKMKKKN